MPSSPHRRNRQGRDARRVPTLLGAREHTMSLIAAVLDDEARKDGLLRRPSGMHWGSTMALGFGCFALGLGVAATWSLTRGAPREHIESTEHGSLTALRSTVDELDDAADQTDAAELRALAQAQRYVWGDVDAAAVDASLEGASQATQARALVLASRGEPAGEDPGTPWRNWALAIRAARQPGDVDAITNAIARLRKTKDAPIGARRTLASLQFAAGDVSAATATLSMLDAPFAVADATLYETAYRRRARESIDDAPPLLQAWIALRQGARQTACANLDETRAGVLPWDPAAWSLALDLSFTCADADGLRTWAESDPRWSTTTRAVTLAHADMLDGRWDDALTRVEDLDARAPTVAFVKGWTAAEQGRWADAARLSSEVQRGAPGRPCVDVFAARVGAHFVDAEVGLGKLEALVQRTPWAPRVWTALGEARAMTGAAGHQTRAAYERALQHEHRPSGAALALASLGDPSETLDLLTMAAAFSPSSAEYLAALGVAQARHGRVQAAQRNLSSAAQSGAADADALLALVDLVSAEAELGAPLDTRVSTWIEDARARGADDDALALARLRVDVLQGVEGAASKARTFARTHPRSAQAQAVAVRALAKSGRSDAAHRVVVQARRRLDRSGRGIVALAEASMLLDDGRERAAAEVAFRAWATMAKHAEPSASLLHAARSASDAWLALGNTNGARAIARELTTTMPESPDAWALRAAVQVAADENGYACMSLDQARALDPNVRIEVTLDCEDSSE